MPLAAVGNLTALIIRKDPVSGPKPMFFPLYLLKIGKFLRITCAHTQTHRSQTPQ